MKSYFDQFSHDNSGASAVKYGLIATAIVICILVVVSDSRLERNTRASTISFEHSAAK